MKTTILERLVEPFAECLTADAARKIVDMRADEETQRRLDELAEMANAGTLTPADKSEYERFLAAFHFVTVLQARARRILKSA
jgi:hypothetical protein